MQKLELVEVIVCTLNIVASVMLSIYAKLSSLSTRCLREREGLHTWKELYLPQQD